MRQMQRAYYDETMKSSMNRALVFFFIGVVWMLFLGSWVGVGIAWLFSGLALGRYSRCRAELRAIQEAEEEQDPENILRGKDD